MSDSQHNHDFTDTHDIELQSVSPVTINSITVQSCDTTQKMYTDDKMIDEPNSSSISPSNIDTLDSIPRSNSNSSISVTDTDMESQPLIGWRRLNTTNSLPESFASVNVASIDAPWYKKLSPFVGLGLMISVGYMDPGNWATDISGGASYGYTMLFVILMSSLAAMLLQYLAMKLGVATQRDLAQAIRDSAPLWVARSVWIVMEVAIAATDLAEILGSAVALNLLFNIPLAAGVAITALDVLLILTIEQKQIRLLELLVGVLTLIITVSFIVELSIAHPVWSEVGMGLLPSTSLLTDSNQLFIAIGIMGATVMPHNLFLHSALVQTRNYERTATGKSMAVRYAAVDSNFSLSIAFFVNAFILILASAAFHMDHNDVADIFTAYTLLSPTLGSKAASILFAIALLASGQQASFTGTLSGQIVMEGLVDMKLKPWQRRLVTRSIAILPALIITLAYNTDSAVNNLLIISQVILSITLSFAVIPLVYITSNKLKMTAEFVNNWPMTIASSLLALIILGLNIFLLVTPATYQFST